MQEAVSVVIPVYQSAGTLSRVVGDVRNALRERACIFEIILVNDGSRDSSWEVVDRLSRELSEVRGINLMRNFGQHNAVLCGIRDAKYDVLVTMDDDGQHPADQIGILLDMLNEGYDVVYGYPEKEQHSAWRNGASIAMRAVLEKAMGVSVARRASSFRAIQARVRDAFEEYRSPVVSIDVLLSWGTTRFGAVPIRYQRRLQGASNYSVRKLVSHTINVMTGFSVAPLRLASMLGFLFTLFGGIVLSYALGCYMIEGGSVPAVPFLASIISVFSGAQLFAVGILGEYLARMHFRMMDRPIYAVRSRTQPFPSTSGIVKSRNEAHAA
jgi:undecaprenyl-phosphate 4-deoxy-4-formamido-L-arabinose transferase